MLNIEIYHDDKGCVHINQICLDNEETIAKFFEEKKSCVMSEGWTPERLDTLAGMECNVTHYRYAETNVEDTEMEEYNRVGWWEEDRTYPSKAVFLGCKVENGLWHIEYQVANDEEEVHEDIAHN